MAKTKILSAFQDVRQDLSAGEIAPVYCLHGGDRWLRQQLVVEVRKAVLKGRGAAFNHDRFVAGQTDPQTVIDSVSTVPMMGRKRLVEVNEAHRWSADQLAELIPALDRFPDHACLLIVADKLDGRGKAIRKMGRMGVALKLDSPDKREIADFLRKEAKKRSIRLEPAASAMLVELVGRDLGAIVASLEKAVLYAGEAEALTADHVKAVVPDLRQVIIFELTDAVSAGEMEKALDALRRLIAEKEPPQRILVMLGRQIRIMWMIVEALRAGVAPNALGSQLGLHPFVAKKLATHARRSSALALRHGHQAICQADQSLKGSKVPADVVLERLVTDLCSIPRPRR